MSNEKPFFDVIEERLRSAWQDHRKDVPILPERIFGGDDNEKNAGAASMMCDRLAKTNAKGSDSATCVSLLFDELYCGLEDYYAGAVDNAQYSFLLVAAAAIRIVHKIENEKKKGKSL